MQADTDIVARTPTPVVDRNGSWLCEFRPLPLLAGRHFQTIVARYWPHRGEWFGSSHHIVDLPDGDKLAIAVSTPPDWRAGDRTVVLVHGLCGCYRSPYMVRVAGRVFERGLRAVRVNLRGCGSGAGLARRPYHSGRSEDIRQVLAWLDRHDESRSAVTLVGFSLGGNIALKLAGEDGDRPIARLDSVVAVSAPIDLNACADLIEQPSNWIYQSHFVRLLVAHARECQRFFPDLPPLDVPRRLTLRAFDDCYTAPRCGFSSALDYYTRASSAPLVPQIAVPALVLVSRDDPFIPTAPFESLPRVPPLEIHITDRGGHLGFLGFTGRRADFHWMDHRIVDWIGRL